MQITQQSHPTPPNNAALQDIHGILFDYGNTLANLRDGASVLKMALSDLGYETGEDIASEAVEASREHWHSHYAALPRGNRWTEEIRLDCQKTGLSAIGFDGDLDKAAKTIDRQWDQIENQGLYNDVIPALKTLHEMGLSLGVLSQTKTTGQQLRDTLETLHIAEYFPTIITSEDAGYDKPDPRLFQFGSTMMRLNNTELCYVGNRYHQDVVGSRNAGQTPVLVERRPRNKPRDCITIPGLHALPSILKRR